ncbi:hypothetical protein [Roseobacter sp.]|uniref:hypothetical protein n=1 Tax=Roseobacter sp. TaxID=1907202 RepID=UPI002967247E|nr:hypothetical protein [Roseobacter sp.]MDW3181756.1 hypothetical protein [Roseobacter sp.]
MDLFIVIFFMAHVGAVAGPLPYGLDECQTRIGVMAADYDRAVVAGELPPRQLQFVCQYAAVRPAISEQS